MTENFRSAQNVTDVSFFCSVALSQIRCQLHDHARQYDNDDACHDDEWNGGKLHGNTLQKKTHP